MEKEAIDFLVIGAQKSGTTSLFKYMQEHPSLYLPAQKEINFFADEDKYSKGAEWYINTYFSGADDRKLWGEVSPHYMAYRCSPARIHRTFPEAKLVAILRNPVDRAYSNYNHVVRKGAETRAFHEVIADQSKTRFHLPETTSGDLWKHYVIGFGLYGQALKQYLHYFDREQIFLLFQEDLLSDPQNVIVRLFDFLGADSSYEPKHLDKKYHKGGVKRFVGLEQRILRHRALKKLIKSLLVSESNLASARFWFEQFNIKPVEYEGISPEERRFLTETYMEDVQLLKHLFSLNTPWPEFEGPQECVEYSKLSRIEDNSGVNW